MPRSVGNVVKMAEHEMGFPFHLQAFKMLFSPLSCDVTPLTSKQGVDAFARKVHGLHITDENLPADDRLCRVARHRSELND